MRLARFIFALLALLAAGLPAQATSSSADADHVHVQLVSTSTEIASRGFGTELGLYFKLEPGWHIYWKNPGDAGEPPHVKWTGPEGISVGPLLFPVPKRLPLGPLMDYGYEDEVLYPAEISVASSTKAGSAVIHAKVDWLVCSSSCIPEKADLELQLHVLSSPLDYGNVGTIADRFSIRSSKSLPEIPKQLPKGSSAQFQVSSDGFRVAVVTGKQETGAAFFPADQDILDNPALQKLTPTATGLILDLKKDANLTANPAQLRGVLELSGGRAYEIAALPAGETATSAGVGAPFEQQASGPKGTADSGASVTGAKAPAYHTPTSAAVSGYWLLLLRTSGLAFLGGLLLNLMPCVFPVLFLKGLALVHSGHKELHKLRAHGIVYTAGILVSFWVLVAVLLGLRAAGATLGWGFQFQSPVFLALMAGLLFFLGLSLAGQFEIGLTLTGAGDSLASKHGYTGSFLTGVLAVVVATPCTAPFMGAAIGYALAQSPAVTFTVFTALALGLAAPYLALTLHPAWTRLLPRPGVWMEILRQAISVPIFITVIWLAWVLVQAYGASLLAALLAAFLLLAIAGWFLGRWPAKRWAMVVAGLILAAVIALCTIAPGKLVAASETVTAPEAHGGWEPWSAEAVSRYQAQGRPVFVDFTASWCLSCQVNERVALSQPEVMQAFKANNVALLKADWTRHNEAITQTLTALGRSGVPAYALYTPSQSQPQMLPEVLTPGIVTDAMSNLPKAAR